MSEVRDNQSGTTDQKTYYLFPQRGFIPHSTPNILTPDSRGIIQSVTSPANPTSLISQIHPPLSIPIAAALVLASLLCHLDHGKSAGLVSLWVLPHPV